MTEVLVLVLATNKVLVLVLGSQVLVNITANT